MNNKYKLDQLVSLLKYNYPGHPAVFEPCCNSVNGCKNSARNGGECAVCIEGKIAEIVGPELATMFHQTTAQAARIYCEMVEKVERQGADVRQGEIENIY